MLKALLTTGYLPKELPPIFSSASMAPLAAIPASLPDPFTKAGADWTAPVAHNLARVGGLRRRLAIPNPTNFFRLARAFADNKAELDAVWSKSTFSHTSPLSPGKRSRALAPDVPDRVTPRAKSRVGARYIVRADISQFYHSIYTHTIPWVLHTKVVAKARIRDLSLCGNRLDKELQACQSGQTKGVAIGPDTSLGIAELLLSFIDDRLHTECSLQGAVRFIDDIELCFCRLSDAEMALWKLEASLNEFELQLNGNKTRILDLPQEIESAYVTDLRLASPQAAHAAPSEWVDYFNRAFALAREHKADGVLRYAVAMLQGVTASNKAWSIAQTLLWQCVSLDPGCLRFVVDVLLLNHYRAVHVIDKDLASSALHALVRLSAPLRHGSEVLWAIWAVEQLDLKLDADAQTLVGEMDDACIAAMATLARGRSFDASFESSLWESWLVEGCFDDEYWLFAYECLKRGWYPAAVKACGIEKHAAATYFEAQGVTFLDDGAVVTYKPPRLKMGGGSAGGGY